MPGTKVVDTWSMGIDLGTTFCCLAFWKMEKVTPIQINGKRCIPSMVGYPEKNDKITCGDVAQAQLSNKDKTILFDAKRYIGKKWTDVHQDEMKYYPFELIENDGMVAYKLKYNNQEIVLTPIDVSAELLKFFQKSASPLITADPGYQITDVVITVPAYFKRDEKDCTRKAAEQAGLHVLALLPEPTSAAISYVHGNQLTNDTLLVYDFGGGTFDVSVIEVKGTDITVLGTGGDDHLGGQDITTNLIEYVVNKVKTDHGYDLTKNIKKIAKLRKDLDEAKINLSLTSEVEITLSIPGEEDDISISITRSLFNQLNQKLFDRTIQIVKNTLNEVGISFGDLKHVVLVGGSSKIPRVNELLTQNFPNVLIHRDIDPEEAVGTGAAFYANLVKTGNNPYRLLTRNTVKLEHSLGIEYISPLNPHSMLPFLKQGSNIPCSFSRNIALPPGSVSLTMDVFSGESVSTKNNTLIIPEYVVQLVKGAKSVDISFDINNENILTVEVKCNGQVLSTQKQAIN